MAKKKICIPVTMIKPIYKSPSIKELLLLPCSQILKTKAVKMVRPCTPTSPTRRLLWKGVLGVITSAVLSSDGKVAISLLDATTAAQIIVGNTKLEGDLVVITPSNKVTPAYLPDLSDLALLPKAAKYFLKWVISTDGGKTGCGYEHVLPKIVEEVVDPPSDILPTIDCCNFPLGYHLLEIPSYINEFKVFTLQHPMYVSNICLHSRTNTSTILDGREMKVKVQVAVNENVSFWNEISTKGLRYFVWNCRDMGRDTFLPLMRSLIEMHMPHFVILTETRVSIHMARLICAYLHPFAVYGISKNECGGGYAMLSFSKDMNMKLISSFPSENYWAFDMQR